MDISVEELTSVDKEITITAGKEDLSSQIDEALRDYRKHINMPGFRPGQAPLSIVKKRYGKEIELEEVQKYLNKVFREEIVPKHNPVGDPEFSDLKWEDGQLEAKIKIGIKPEFDLVDPATVTVDMMVHDVTDEDVNKEIEHALEHRSEWEEKEGKAGEKDKVVIDAIALDDKGKPKEEDRDEDQEIDLGHTGNEKLRKVLLGKKVGDIVKVDLGEGGEKQMFQLLVKKVMARQAVELTDELAKELSTGEAENIDQYRGYLKSRIQDYYDQAGKDMARNELADKLVKAHDFEVPDRLVGQIQQNYVNQVKQRYGDNLPGDFDEENYSEEMKDQSVRDAKWYFISEKLQDKYDIEITSEDIDERLTEEAARYGLTVDMLKQYYASSGDQLEQLRLNIRDEKMFGKLLEEVKFNELSKDAYQKKHEKKKD